jgi:hypothetical protein
MLHAELRGDATEGGVTPESVREPGFVAVSAQTPPDGRGGGELIEERK